MDTPLLERTPHGLRLRGTPLHLEPLGRAELGFLAHARGVRATLPERVIASAGTLSLLEPRALQKSAPLPAQFGSPFTMGPLRVSLHPAGHVLGSAQLKCELQGRVIVYAGDLGGSGGRAPATAEPRQQLECDTLVLRATYGAPRYVFPPREEVLQRLAQFVAQCLADGVAPVVRAATIGGAQEVARFLGDRGHRLRLHAVIHRVALAYERLGVRFQDLELYEGPPAPGEVVVLPADLRRPPPFEHRAVLVSGRGIDDASVLPLSDHAGFDELVAYAVASGAERILCTHGHAEELAAALRERGLDARTADHEKQLELPI